LLLTKKIDNLALFIARFKYLHAEQTVKNTCGRSDFEVRERKNLGKHGEYMTHYLTEYGSASIVNESLLYNPETPTNLLAQVSLWMGRSAQEPVCRKYFCHRKPLYLIAWSL